MWGCSTNVVKIKKSLNFNGKVALWYKKQIKSFLPWHNNLSLAFQKNKTFIESLS
jgi:hypothetical protein